MKALVSGLASNLGIIEDDFEMDGGFSHSSMMMMDEKVLHAQFFNGIFFYYSF